MHILYIHQYFSTRAGSAGTRSYEFAWRWVKAGHKVTMLTTTVQLTDSDLKDAAGSFFKRFTIDGIDVLALAIPYRQQMGMFKRCLAFLAFLLLASVVVLFLRKVDVVYATSTPITVGIPALVARWFRRKKIVFEVRDQWPVVPIEMGIITNKVLIKVLLWLERLIYKSSAAIVALSPGQAEGVKKVLAEDKLVVVIPNCCDTDIFRQDIDGSAVRKKMGWEDSVVFLQAGAMGKLDGLDFVIDAAERLRGHNDILFVLIGDGNQKPALQSRVRELGLTNMEILPSVPRHQLPAILAAADVIMAIIGKFSIMERHASLNKFFDAISAGKPVLLNYSGWLREILEDNEAGFGCELCNLDEFVERVLYFYSHREKLSEVGRNARRIAIEKFDRDRLAARALGVVSSVTG